MSDTNPLDGFLNEMMASMSQVSRDAMMRRVNAERLIKLTIENLVEQHQAESIRLLSDEQLTAKESADYLIQIDDYDLRVELLDAPNGQLTLDENLLTRWEGLLEANSNTIALIIVWTNDELLSIAFSMRRLKYIVESPNELAKLLQTAAPFEKVIAKIIKKQTKGWKIPKIEKSGSPTANRDLYSIFSQKIITAIDTEANRSYRVEERARAAQKFPYEQEKRTILSILQDALEGATAKDLEKRLTNLPRRGEQ